MNETVDNAETASVEHQEAKDDDTVAIEAEASKMGWKPEEQFRGDKSRWVDAKTFVERGETVLPIVKAELRKTREELAETKKAAQEWQEFLKEANKREVEEWKGKYQQAVTDKAAAITSGDGEKAIEAEARQKELEANRPETKKEAPQLDPMFVAWRERNDWFDVDEERTDIAIGVGMRLRKKGLVGDAFFSALDAAMEKRAAPAPRSGPQRGGRPSGDSKGARSYENLKPKFREACDRMVGSLGIKREQYVEGCDDEAFGR